MAFEEIECVGASAPKGGKVPADGVRVTARYLGSRGGEGRTHYIRVQIGAGLAKGIALAREEHGLRVLFGTDEDAGKIRVSVDNEAGKFRAKRDKAGNFSFTINAATADGLFSLTFPEFSEARIEAIRPANGQPPHFVFRAHPAMLAVED